MTRQEECAIIMKDKALIEKHNDAAHALSIAIAALTNRRLDERYQARLAQERIDRLRKKISDRVDRTNAERAQSQGA